MMTAMAWKSSPAPHGMATQYAQFDSVAGEPVLSEEETIDDEIGGHVPYQVAQLGSVTASHAFCGCNLGSAEHQPHLLGCSTLNRARTTRFRPGSPGGKAGARAYSSLILPTTGATCSMMPTTSGPRGMTITPSIPTAARPDSSDTKPSMSPVANALPLYRIVLRIAS